MSEATPLAPSQPASGRTPVTPAGSPARQWRGWCIRMGIPGERRSKGGFSISWTQEGDRERNKSALSGSLFALIQHNTEEGECTGDNIAGFSA